MYGRKSLLESCLYGCPIRSIGVATRRQSQAPPGVPQRIHLSLQPPVMANGSVRQHLGERDSCLGTDLRSALPTQMVASECPVFGADRATRLGKRWNPSGLSGCRTAAQRHSRCNNPQTAIWWSIFSPPHLGTEVFEVMFRPISLFLVLRATTVGWPRAVTHPGLPQIRTCGTPASGSSVYEFAARW